MLWAMGRWVPGAQARLIQAAMDLYSERGYEQTTVAEIAKRAGLTERTFFRYFADKREVLFFGSELLERAMVDALEAAPANAAPIDAVGAALESIATFFTDRRPHSKRRQAVIGANPELQERERNKLAGLAAAMAAALQRRGVRASAATLAAEMGVAVFKVAFERWLTDPKRRDIASHVRESLKELRLVSAGQEAL
jgi:AcrR family transcriptional regulator